jgi:hypothetical protein
MLPQSNCEVAREERSPRAATNCDALQSPPRTAADEVLLAMRRVA